MIIAHSQNLADKVHVVLLLSLFSTVYYYLYLLVSCADHDVSTHSDFIIMKYR